MGVLENVVLAHDRPSDFKDVLKAVGGIARFKFEDVGLLDGIRLQAATPRLQLHLERVRMHDVLCEDGAHPRGKLARQHDRIELQTREPFVRGMVKVFRKAVICDVFAVINSQNITMHVTFDIDDLDEFFRWQLVHIRAASQCRQRLHHI